MQFTVACGETVGPLDHFWHSTGFTPARLLLDERMHQTLDYVAGVAHGGITHLRPHFMLDLVGAKGLGTGTVRYDWSQLDAACDTAVGRGLKFFFELMGNPAGFFHDFTDNAQLAAWQRLVTDLVGHLQERYGVDKVRSWWFECWNEPDVGWFPQWKAGNWPALNAYFDACVAGLHAADAELRIGGPGSAHHLSDGFKAFVAHCDDGEDRISGRRGLPIHFVSTHVKGGFARGDALLHPDLALAMRQKREQLAYLREHHPRLAQLAIVDNECDPMVPWRLALPWRPRPYYPAWVTRLLDAHLRILRDREGADFAFLSHDNGFLGDWGQRTHLASFGGDDRLARGEFELIKKPVFNVMSLWALQGERRLAVAGHDAELPELGIIASARGEDQIALLLYHNRDDCVGTGRERVALRLTGLPFASGRLAHYRLTEEVPYAYRTWLEREAPKDPDPDCLAAMRAVQEPQLVSEPAEVAADAGELELEVDLPLPGVDLLLLNADPGAPPARPSRPTLRHYRGLHQEQQVMLSWPDVPGRRVRTYEVLAADAPDGEFRRVNGPNLIDACFLHVRPPTDALHYRVRAVDYWGRAGEASETVEG